MPAAATAAAATGTSQPRLAGREAAARTPSRGIRDGGTAPARERSASVRVSSSSVFIDVVLHLAAEGGQAAMRGGLHGADGDADRVRRLGLRQLAVVAEHDHL